MLRKEQPYLHTSVHGCCQHPPKGLGCKKSGSKIAPKHTCKHAAHLHPKRVDSNDSGFICAGVTSNLGSYKRNALHNLSWTLQIHPRLSKHRGKNFHSRRNHLWQWLEEGCCKPVLGVWQCAWSAPLSLHTSQVRAFFFVGLLSWMRNIFLSLLTFRPW